MFRKNLLKIYKKNETEEEDVKRATHKKRYISPEERQQIIDQLKLVAERM